MHIPFECHLPGQEFPTVFWLETGTLTDRAIRVKCTDARLVQNSPAQ